LSFTSASVGPVAHGELADLAALPATREQRATPVPGDLRGTRDELAPRDPRAQPARRALLAPLALMAFLALPDRGERLALKDPRGLQDRRGLTGA
jgi:hypothetical protein